MQCSEVTNMLIWCPRNSPLALMVSMGESKQNL